MEMRADIPVILTIRGREKVKICSGGGLMAARDRRSNYKIKKETSLMNQNSKLVRPQRMNPCLARKCI
jgi:hypothetical protein